jgi:[ribosomal protein S18]-alanine N-acetyltransferase
MHVREGTLEDFGALREILNASPEAAQWLPEGDEAIVAEDGESLAGFVVWRRIASDEIEILNLAVQPAFRRRGVAKALLGRLPKGDVFLEVRESNLAARGLYQAAGFREVGLRRGYYQNPPEGAVVMRLQS